MWIPEQSLDRACGVSYHILRGRFGSNFRIAFNSETWYAAADRMKMANCVQKLVDGRLSVGSLIHSSWFSRAQRPWEISL